MRLGGAFSLDTLLVVTVNIVLRVLFVRQHDEGRLVCDDLVFQADAADEIRVFCLIL